MNDGPDSKGVEQASDVLCMGQWYNSLQGLVSQLGLVVRRVAVSGHASGG